ncbi:hypothetical protein CLU79DRAFT_739454 [Phycomyces nitens]|nr:hypothetical protein CLU79DRAFT_739454 [Phycomyces nitens]
MTFKRQTNPLTPVQTPLDLFSPLRSRLSLPHKPLFDDSQTKRLENLHWRLWFRKSGQNIKPATISPITPPYSLNESSCPKLPDSLLSCEPENPKEDDDKEDDDETVFDEDNPSPINSHDCPITFTKQTSQNVCRKSLLTSLLLGQKMPRPLVVSPSTTPEPQLACVNAKARMIQNTSTCLQKSLVRSSEWRPLANVQPVQMHLLETYEDESINSTSHDQPWTDSFRCW